MRSGFQRCTIHPDAESARFLAICWSCGEYLNDGKPVSLDAAAELADVHDAKHVESERGTAKAGAA